MSVRLLAEFADSERLVRAIRQVRAADYRIADAFTPFAVEEVHEAVDAPASAIRPIMLLVGIAAAAVAYALQWYSAVIDYPIDSGGRPLHSWPVFLLVPFEVAVFLAAVAGVAVFLWQCGLPRLHDPLFAVPGFERATQDRFFILAETDVVTEGVRLRHVLEDAGALVVTQVWEP